MSYFERLKEYDGFFRRVAQQYHVPGFLIRLDCVSTRLLHGAAPSDYVGFSMYRLSGRERRSYVTFHRSHKIERLFNTGSAAEMAVIGDKHIFNQTFSAFVHRDWIYAPDHTDEEILAFLQRHPEIMVKPLSQSKGIGLRKERTTEMSGDALAAFLQTAKQDKLLLEEVIRQHPVLDEVNQSSVNTVRICSVRDKTGEVHVVGASLRCGGAGSIVDNLHANGVQYPVDVATGCIIRGGVKHNGEKNILFHPTNNTKMIGLQIPNWENVVKTVKEAGKIPANMRYIGWDVAITADGCELIEANYKQGSNGMQQDGIGKYDVIMEYK